MNYIKLNELAAQAMGWTREWQGYQGYANREPPIGIMWWKSPPGENSGPVYEYVNNTTDCMCQEVVQTMFARKWNPCGDLNDASALLEKAAKVAGDKHCTMTISPGRVVRYEACISIRHGNAVGLGNSLSLAMTLSALRAFGIPESSITEAQED